MQYELFNWERRVKNPAEMRNLAPEGYAKELENIRAAFMAVLLSSEQDTTIERLQTRGVKFLSCHNSNQVLAHELVEKNSLKISPEDLVKDLQAHTVPGVLIVPAMVAAITLLQSEGHYTYITI